MKNVARYRPNNRRKHKQCAGTGESFGTAYGVALLLKEEHKHKKANARNDDRGQVQFCRSGPQRIGKQPDNVLVAKNTEVLGVEQEERNG